jgi:hypothetical protein
LKNIARLLLVLAALAFQLFAPFSPGVDGEIRFLISQASAQHHPGREGDAHHSDTHGSANTGSPGAASSASRASTEAAVNQSRTVGDYALDFLAARRLQAGTEGRLSVTVTDRASGTPARGLPVELVLIHLQTPKEGGGHGVPEAAGHTAEKDQRGSTYHTVTPLPLIEDEHRPGSYEAKHAFQEAGSHLVLIKLRPDLRQYAALPLLVEDAGRHQAGGAGPNYLFISFLLSTVAVTILMVAFLRQREQPDRMGEAR